MVEEVLDAQKPHCPAEYFNIEIPPGHEYRNSTGLDQMPLLRTRYDASSGIGPNNPRQQVIDTPMTLLARPEYSNSNNNNNNGDTHNFCCFMSFNSVSFSFFLRPSPPQRICS